MCTPFLHLNCHIRENTKNRLLVQITDFSVERNDDDELAKPRVPDDLLKKIAGLCVQVEDVFGSPQDIEWTAGIEVTYIRFHVYDFPNGEFFSLSYTSSKRRRVRYYCIVVVCRDFCGKHKRLIRITKKKKTLEHVYLLLRWQ